MIKNTTKPPESALKLASGMLDTGLHGLRTYVRVAAKGLKLSKDTDQAEQFAHLLTKIAQVAGELRKAEAAERKAADAISKVEWLEWFRRQDTTEQQRLLRELQNLTTKGSGLA